MLPLCFAKTATVQDANKFTGTFLQVEGEKLMHPKEDRVLNQRNLGQFSESRECIS